MHQQLVRQALLDGWLLYDFRGSNTIACDLLTLKGHLTRRLFYWIPAEGEPIKLVHKIESHHLDHLPGRVMAYASYQELDEALANILEVSKTVAMEVSPNPYTSMVDGGTLDLVRRHVEVVASEELVLQATPPLSEKQKESHRKAADILDLTVERAFLYIRDSLEGGVEVSELDVQEFILCEFAAQNLITDHPPICARGENSADPHHSPTRETIERGDMVLIDLWGKLEGGIFADITRVAVADDKVSARQQEIFDLVKAAQEAAIKVAQVGARGCEVDEAARSVIREAGYEEFFTHRTGHNIGTELHGPGTHMDNYETRDTRPILPGTCFSIEPGIYLPGEFGIRLECDVLVPEVTGKPQRQLGVLLRR